MSAATINEIGARVRVNQSARSAGFPSSYRGICGTVTEIRQFGLYEVRVALDAPAVGLGTWFRWSELEPAPQPSETGAERT